MAKPLEDFTFDEKYVIPRNGSCGYCYVSMGYFSWRSSQGIVIYIKQYLVALKRSSQGIVIYIKQYLVVLKRSSQGIVIYIKQYLVVLKRSSQGIVIYIKQYLVVLKRRRYLDYENDSSICPYHDETQCSV
jgi:hypothetical protein